MDNCLKCGAIIKTKEGKYSSQVGSEKVIFTQILTCDNKECSNNGIVLATVEHELN